MLSGRQYSGLSQGISIQPSGHITVTAHSFLKAKEIKTFFPKTPQINPPYLVFCISDNIDLCILVHGSLVNYIYLGSTPNIWASMGLAVQGSNVPSGSAFSPTCFLCSFVKLRNISPLLSQFLTRVGNDQTCWVQ